MGADVGEAVDLVVVIAGEEEGFVDGAFQERAGIDVAGGFDDVGVGEELPGAGEGFAAGLGAAWLLLRAN